MSEPLSPSVDARHELRHGEAMVEEWGFTVWTPTLDAGVVSVHRVVNRMNWYLAAFARTGRPLLHVGEFDAPVRSDPFIIKASALWAEHTCDAALEQWSIGNETYAAALDHPDEALGRAYGAPTPIAFDVEWYGTEPATWVSSTGYVQTGVAHGALEIAGEPTYEFAEIPAQRWHRWSVDGELPGTGLGEARVHAGLRAPFRLPNDEVLDFVLTPNGWSHRSS